MEFDTLVIGGGMTGIVAALAAAEKGRVALVRKGLGATALSSGAIDIADNPQPIPHYPGERSLSIKDNIARLKQVNPYHPYSIINLEEDLLKRAFKFFFSLVGLSFLGSIERNNIWPNSFGSYKFCAFVQHTQAEGELKDIRAGRILILGLKGLRYFSPLQIAQNLKYYFFKDRERVEVIGDWLTLPQEKTQISSIELAKALDQKDFSSNFVQIIKNHLEGKRITHLFLPPFLGYYNSAAIKRELEKVLGVRVFEPLALHYSVPGLRLQNCLDMALGNKNVTAIQGKVVEVRKGSFIESVEVETPENRIQLKAKQYILATGKYLSGGIEKKRAFKETVFGLPVFYQDQEVREEISQEFLNLDYLKPQKIFQCGVRVNKNLYPVDSQGKIIFSNLKAAGAVLSGYDLIREGTGLGVSIITGYLAGKPELSP